MENLMCRKLCFGKICFVTGRTIAPR